MATATAALKVLADRRASTRSAVPGGEVRADLLASPETLAAGLTAGQGVPYLSGLPHLRLIDEAFLGAVTTPGSKVGIFMPPRHGKSLRLRWCLLWYLATHPDQRIIIATASQPLADAHGRWIRNMIRDHGERLGIELDPGSMAANRLDLRGRDGGMFATSVGGAGSGFGADILLVDDPVKDRKDAESRTVMGATEDWWSDVATTRLSPTGSIVLMHTRWSDNDLAGRLLARDRAAWHVVDCPAVAMSEAEYALLGLPSTPDPLGRAPGEVLDPARWPPEVLAARRRDVGESAWWALFQQQPRRPEGALLTPADLTRATVQDLPDAVRTVVALDPAGDGDDEAGVIGAVKGTDGRAYLIADRSGRMGAAQWPEVAVALAAETGASAFVVEGNGVGQAARRLLALAWEDLVRNGGVPSRRLMPQVLVKTATESKWARAEPVAGLIRSGAVAFGPGMGRCAHEFLTWTPTAKLSPGRLDAAVWAVTELNPQVVTPSSGRVLDPGAPDGWS